MTTVHRDGLTVADHAIGRRGRLAVRLPAAQVRLAATDGDRIVVRTPDGMALPDRVLIEPSDGAVTIREKDHGISFSIGRRLVQLEIDLPAGSDVVVDIASGWLDVIGLRGEQRYRLVSAESRLTDCAGRIELSTVSGDATMELVDATELAIKSVSGDVSVRGGSLDSLRVATTSGDVRIDSPLVGRTGNTVETLSGDVAIAASSGLRVEARTVSGDLSSDLPHRSDGRMGRRSLVIGDGSVELGFRSVSGDLRILGAGTQATATTPPTARPFTSEPEPPVAPVRPVAPVPPLASVRPVAPAPRFAPEAPAGSATPTPGTAVGAPFAPGDEPVEARRMEILRALEHGELDVPTAMDRLAALDGDPDHPEERTDG